MDFYHWGYGMRRGALGVALLDRDKDGLLRGERRPAVPVPTKHLVGRRVGDILWAEIYPVVSERVVHALGESGLTGWATYPVVLTGEDGEVVPGFHGLAVVGRCRSIDIDQSRTIVVDDLEHWQGLLWDHSTWDGADFFMAADRKTRFKLMTARARDVLRRHRFKWFEATPSTEFRMVAY